MPEYTVLADFGVDNGELEGCSIETAFVLGAEYMNVVSKMRFVPNDFTAEVHVQNRQRLTYAAWRSRRRIEWTEGPVSDVWVQLKVKAEA